MLGSVACLAWTFKPIRIFHQTRSDSAYIADSRDKSRGDISAVYKPKTQAVKHQRFVWMGGAESVSFECNTPGSARPRGCALGGAPGACQDSCHLSHAAKGCLFVLAVTVATTDSRSGLSVTGPVGDQFRVWRDQRAGWRSRASTYKA